MKSLSGNASQSGARGGGGGAASQSGAAAAAPARAMLLTDLSLDEIGAVLGEINEAEDIARTASVCKAFKLAAQHAAKARAALYEKLVSLPKPKKNESLLRVLRFAENMMNLSQATLAAGNGETLIAEVKVIGLGSRDEIHVASRKDVTDAVFSCGMGEVQPMMLSREGDLQVAVSASRGSFFVVSSGCVWSWGENDVGQLGLGDTEDRTRPTPTPEHLHLWNTYIWQVAAGDDHTLFLTEAGDVLAVGDGELGPVGYPLRRRCGGVGDSTEEGARLRWPACDMCECGACQQCCCRRGWWSLDVGQG